MNFLVQTFAGKLNVQEKQVQRLESKIVEGLKLAKGRRTDFRTFQDRVVEVIEDVRRKQNGLRKTLEGWSDFSGREVKEGLQAQRIQALQKHAEELTQKLEEVDKQVRKLHVREGPF